MRNTFFQTLEKLAEKEPRIVLLTADLGYSVLEPFAEKFPDRFYNVGVAEQNMVGISTGMAEAGLIPFVYSIATFVSLRAYEFIRNGPILHKLPVRIIGIGGGFEYSRDGITHLALEDIGIMRVQPGISIIAPADFEQAGNALIETWNLPGPIYYQIGKNDKATIHGLNGRFKLGRTEMISEGKDLLFITMGSIAEEVAEAVNILATDNISSTVIVVSSINPTPVDDLSEALFRFSQAFVVEAHYVNCGLGSLVSEIVAEKGIRCKIKRCGVNTMPVGSLGSQNFQYQKFGLSGKKLAEIARQSLLER